MDVKQATFYARLELYGVHEPIMFEGPIVRIIAQATHALMQATVRKSPAGSRDFSIRFSDSPLPATKGQDAPADIVEQYKREWLESGDVIQMTNEEVEALSHPITKDSQWTRFRYLSATQSNFESSPEEYNTLWSYFESQWPDVMRNEKRRSLGVR